MLKAAVVSLGSAPLPTANGFSPKVEVLEPFEDFRSRRGPVTSTGSRSWWG
jgi:hypothetical protein